MSLLPGKMPRRDMVKTGHRQANLSMRNGYDVFSLAQELFLSPSTVRSYWDGRRFPSVESLEKMRLLFHLGSIDDLIVWEDVENG